MGATMSKIFSNRWNFILCLFPIIGTLAQAQTVTTYHSKFGIAPVKSSYLAVDIAVTDAIQNPNYRPLYRVYGAPALIDTEYKLGVTITGTVAQAEADLATAISNAVPAIAHYKGRDQRDEVRKDRETKEKNPNAAAKRGDMLELTRQIEALIERVQMLEQKQ